MYEYVYFLGVILGDNHHLPVELTIDKSIRLINVSNLSSHTFLSINHNRGNNVKDIVRLIKMYVTDKFQSIYFLKDHEYCEIFYCFGIAPENVRWDLIRLGSIKYDDGKSEPIIKVTSNFTKIGENLPIKRIKTKTKFLKTTIKSKIMRYIDKIQLTQNN